VTERFWSQRRISYRVHSGRSDRWRVVEEPGIRRYVFSRFHTRFTTVEMPRGSSSQCSRLCTAAANPDTGNTESPNDGAKASTLLESSTNAHANSQSAGGPSSLSLDAIAVLRDLCRCGRAFCSQPVAPTVELRRFFQAARYFLRRSRDC